MKESKFFPEIRGNFGFGCMRLPMKGGAVDYDGFSRMADAFIDAGFNYFDTAHGYIGGQSETAIRFAASFPNMAMVLSGMSNMAQMTDNLGAMRDFKPLDDVEMAAVRRVCDIFKSLNLIPCTSCRYCVEENECPKGIRIPDMFSSLNAHEAFHNWNTGYYYEIVITGGGHGKASDCIRCGKCEKVCPQHLPIRELLQRVAKTFDTIFQ